MGITFRASIQQTPCSVITDQTLLAASKGDGSGTTEGLECCEGSLLNKAKNGCGSTMASPTGHRKRNANGRNDGGLYAARKVMLQNLYTQYRCKEACVLQDKQNPNLGYPLTKTSQGTCLTWDSGAAGCTAQQQTGSTDCSPCVQAYNNVAPKSASQFQIGLPGASTGTELIKAIRRVQQAPPAEPLGNVLNSGGQPLVLDDTAKCHTDSTFSCGDKGKISMADYEKLVKDGKCKAVESKKIDGMCDDGPCDNDPNSELCRIAKAKCEVDPQSGTKCMPGNENNPCKDCIVTWDGGEVAAVAFTSLLVLASVL